MQRRYRHLAVSRALMCWIINVSHENHVCMNSSDLLHAEWLTLSKAITSLSTLVFTPMYSDLRDSEMTRFSCMHLRRRLGAKVLLSTSDLQFDWPYFFLMNECTFVSADGCLFTACGRASWHLDVQTAGSWPGGFAQQTFDPSVYDIGSPSPHALIASCWLGLCDCSTALTTGPKPFGLNVWLQRPKVVEKAAIHGRDAESTLLTFLRHISTSLLP